MKAEPNPSPRVKRLAQRAIDGAVGDSFPCSAYLVTGLSAMALGCAGSVLLVLAAL